MKAALNSPRSEDENTRVQGGLQEPPAAAKPPEPALESKPEPKAAKVPAAKGKRKEAEPKAPKPKAKKAEKKAEAPKPAAPSPPDGVKESLVKFVAVRTWERYPETRRMAPGPLRALARSRLEEHPEVLEAYRKNRRRGEQDALPIVRALAEELAGRAPQEEAES